MVNNDDLSAGAHKFNIQQTQPQTSSKEEEDDNESRKQLGPHNDVPPSPQPQSQHPPQTHLKSVSILEAPTNSLQQVAPGSASAGHRQLPMSCYVCSTMDYENPQENLCRNLKYHPRLSQQPAGGHYLAEGLTERQLPQANLMPSTRDTSTSGPEASGAAMVPSNGTKFLTSGQSGSFFSMANQRASSNTHVRTRPCLDDENFCSIVSIVKIEFSNDNISSKFWAMER